MHLMVLLGDKAQLEARFGPFGNSANLGDKAQQEAYFGPFGDSANLDAR
jgi:hypothetical protein